jgi:integrase
VDQEAIADNPLESVAYPKQHRPQMLILTAEQLQALVVQEGLLGLRDQALVAMYAWGAYRASEPVSLRVGELDLEEGALRLSDTKTRRFELRLSLPAPEELVLLWLQSPERPESPWVFPGRDPRRHLSHSAANEVVRKAGVRAGIPQVVTPQLLRHTVATLLADNGAAAEDISALLGHSSRETTRRYIDRGPEPIVVRETLLQSRLTWLLDQGLV